LTVEILREKLARRLLLH